MATHAEEGLGKWPVRREVAVQWGDMDAFQHVNNTVYMRWFETVRIAYFESLSVASSVDQPGPKPILARAEIDYRMPVTYPDMVLLEATILKLGTSSFVMGYRASSKTLGKLAAEGEAVVVMIDTRTGRPTPLPQTVRDLVRALEK